jgi:hypothetical protein
MPKFVVSTTLKDPEWSNTTVLDGGDATAAVRRLKEEFDGELQVPGSHRLVQELIESDLVDQINLMVFPVIVGDEVHGLHDSHLRDDVEESCLDDVGVRGRFARRGRAVGVGQQVGDLPGDDFRLRADPLEQARTARAEGAVAVEDEHRAPRCAAAHLSPRTR